MTFDWTLHVGDVIMAAIALLVWPLGRLLLELRDSARDLRKAVGQHEPPAGLLGDMQHVRHEQRKHRDWLIELRGRSNGT